MYRFIKIKTYIMPFNVGLPELLLISFLAILFFGRDKLTGLAKDMGSSIRTFKSELTATEEAAQVNSDQVKTNDPSSSESSAENSTKTAANSQASESTTKSQA
jgi:sec-independent protein translocase protein TatA